MQNLNEKIAWIKKYIRDSAKDSNMTCLFNSWVWI